MCKKNQLYYLISAINIGIKTKKFSIIINNFSYLSDILFLFQKAGFIHGFCCQKKKVEIFLKYFKEKSVIRKIEGLSSTSTKKYVSFKEINKKIIYSTAAGILNFGSMKKKKIGGEPLIKITS